MSLLDVISELFTLGSEGTVEDKIKPPKVLFWFYILLVISLICVALEAKSISNLQSPFIFLIFFGTIGIILSFITMYFLWRTGSVEFFTTRFAIIILIPVLFLTIALASFVNTSKSEHGRLGFDFQLIKQQ